MLFLCNFTTRKQKVIIKERNEAYISFVCIFVGRLDLCLSADAQLVVDSLGRIGMGTDTPTYPFDIKGPGTGATIAGL